MAGEAPIEEALAAADQAQRDDEARRAPTAAARGLLNTADQLMDEVERCNLAGIRLPGSIATRILSLEEAEGQPKGSAPTDNAEALDRLYGLEQRLCRRLQRWWYDFLPPEEAHEA
jgi:hypothetical protein